MNFKTSDRWFYYKYGMLQRQTNVFLQAFSNIKKYSGCPNQITKHIFSFEN